MKRKAVALALCLACLCTLLLVNPVFAAAKLPKISVAEVNGEPGQSVQVPITIENNPGILGAKLQISYDAGLTLTGAKNGAAFSALTMTKPGQFGSPCNFLWDGQELEPEDIIDDTILTLTFTIGEKTGGQTLGVRVSYEKNNIVDQNKQAVNPETANGGVRVVALQGAAPTSATASYEGSDVLLKADCKEKLQNVKIFLASYAANGAMTSLKMKTVTLQAGENSFTFSGAAKSDEQKMFLVQSGGQPLCGTVKVAKTYKVTFKDYDGSTISEQSVPEGGDAVLPPDPVREGYEFTGWLGNWENVTEDRTVTAQYREDASAQIIVKSVTAQPGATDVKMEVLVQNNPGILGAMLTIHFDDTALTLKKAKNGTAVSSVLSLTTSKVLENGSKFIWDGVEIEPEDVEDGVLVTLTFDIGAKASGEYPVTFTYNAGDIVDGEKKPVSPKITNGSITVGQ